MSNKKIVIRNASEHNLKSVDVDILHGHLTVVTGVSGSGKSSLVFDTICKEGQRRYLESFSAYARQFLGKLGRPQVGHISGLSPAIAIDQKTVVRNPRSTVGTMTELYDYLRLLFARLGDVGETGTVDREIKLQRSLFSFNSPYGACPVCKGLGVQDRIDTALLIADDGKTLREGALGITTPTGYIIYSQVTMDVLNQVCEAEGFNADIPWRDLTEQQKHIVLYGSDKIKIPYGKHPLESRLKWSGITAKPREEGYYKGILPVMENILRVDRNKNILRFARSMTCEACNGTRLKPEALAVTYRGQSIAQMAGRTIEQLYDTFTGLEFRGKEALVAEPVRQEFLKRIGLLKKLGLGYLTLDRESTTLSGGEAQRIRLATQVGTGLRGILYILDEPSIGLHQRDNERLLEMLRLLRDGGNTVVVVEHDEDTVRSADRIIDIGPAAGIHGGEVLFNGPAKELLEKTPPESSTGEIPPAWVTSKTHAFFTGKETIEVPQQRRSGSGRFLKICGAGEHNLKNIDVPFRLGVLNVVTGVSGAGKSTLVHDILANYLKKHLHNANTQPGHHAGIECTGEAGGKTPAAESHGQLETDKKESCDRDAGSLKGIIDKIIEIDQAPIGRTPRSNPATYTKLFDHIRDLFAVQPEAKERKWGKGRFSFNVKGGRCESCEGAGLQQIGMHFMGSVDVVCHDCGGKRFNKETLEIRFNEKSIYDILEMPINEAVGFFKEHAKISRFLAAMQDLGLGYIALGQSSTTLSGGEAQRIKLAAELCKPATGKTLYIFDEPTTGLHSADIKILLQSLQRLVEKGNTVITVEHHPDFVKTADWVVDLGPESGEQGGQLAAVGTPEDVALSEISHTGQYLLELLTGKHDNSTGPEAPPVGKESEPIVLKGVTTHNLKNIDVEIPVNQLTVITGVSGSGKSSLAFDTLFAEGQQRFFTSFSTYARRLMANRPKAEMESCTGLMPTIAISQKAAARNPRSTVGTMTELYDYYRLLFARVGKRYCPDCGGLLEAGKCPGCGYKGQDTLYGQMFSFNHHQGACSVCKGLGVITVCDPLKLVTHPLKSLLSGALDGSKTGKFYGDPFGQHTAILRAVGEHRGIDFAVSWEELADDAREIAMHGTGEQVYDVNWQYKRKNREGEHRFETVWLGFAGYVDEEYERKHADSRGEAMLPLMKDDCCPQCKGERLKPEFLAVTFAGVNISQLCAKTVKESIAFFRRLESANDGTPVSDGPGERDLQVSGELRREILRRLEFLRDVGLEYLSADRNAVTLSGGEAQRIRLASQLGSGLTGVTYILDEPTIGLHARDTQRLLSVLKGLRDSGNTVVVVEHDADVMREADFIIDLGPGAGASGGGIVAQGSVDQIIHNDASKTGKYLQNPDALPVPAQKRSPGEGIRIGGAFANNLKNIDVHIPSGGVVVLTGVSGSGKSTLLFDVLSASVQRGEAVGCRSFSGAGFSNIITVDQKGIGSSPASNPATYTGLFDKIRDLFAKTEPAKTRGYKKNRFSFNVKGGRCEACQGMGAIRTPMDFLADVWMACEECKGKRYNAETLECLFQSQNIAQVLSQTIDEALEFFSEYPALRGILEKMSAVGLGYLQLGQPGNTLSGGESQRLKLVSELIKGKSPHHMGKGNNNLYLFDEPTTGLHFEDVGRLLNLFNSLVKAGHSVLVIEHHPDVIKSADYVIDLGPEGGHRGGEVVAKGTPAEIMKEKSSYTGEVLAAKKR